LRRTSNLSDRVREAIVTAADSQQTYMPISQAIEPPEHATYFLTKRLSISQLDLQE
jgi:hypothetical protein